MLLTSCMYCVGSSLIQVAISLKYAQFQSTSSNSGTANTPPLIELNGMEWN